MNYIVLNDNDFFKDIKIKNFKEVPVDGGARVDGIFGSITPELLENGYNIDGEGNSFFREQWLCGNSGTIFMVLRFPQDILYDGTGQSLERCLGFFNPESVYVEIWAIKLKNKEKYEYFLVAYNKNLGFKLLCEEKFVEKEEDEVLDFVLEKIKKIL